MRRWVVATVALVAALAGCSSGSTKAAEPPAPTPSAPGEFGPGCLDGPMPPASPTPTVSPKPTDGFPTTAGQPFVTAISGNPLLSTLVSAVVQADLGESLNAAPALTVFAPSNEAFGKIPPDRLAALLTDISRLKEIIRYHVIAQRLTPAELAGVHRTLAGRDLTVTGGGTEFMVGNAKVVCDNVATGNAIVYVIDTVLLPA